MENRKEIINYVGDQVVGITAYTDYVTYLPAEQPPFFRGFKRVADVVIALGGLIVFMLPIAIIALLVWAEDKHSPIFRQERIGKGGKPFMLYKFRSMRVDAESAGKPQLCTTGGRDPRLTRVGAFIRAHHLDEFPQLWNILKGDMSFVGYRPERQYFINQIMEADPRYEELYSMRPGVFSEATLYNGYTDTLQKMLTRLRMDLDYIHNPSVKRDFSIIWKTSISILKLKKF